MMRSMYSGVAGLKTHQTKMDVIGNNIANVNTVAYKSQSVTFSELMYQTTQNASGPNALTGTAGINARQIGLGVKLGAINTQITTEGASQTTNNPFDIRITGDTFFIVRNATDTFFTRDGSFYVDAAGNLAMTSNGYNVMGWQVDPETMDIKKDTVTPLRIMSPENMTYPPEATTDAYIAGILDKNDTDVTSASGKTMNLQFYDRLGYSYTAKLLVKDTADEGIYTVELDKILDSNNIPLDIEEAEFGSGQYVPIIPETKTLEQGYYWDDNGALIYQAPAEADGTVPAPATICTVPAGDPDWMAIAAAYGVDTTDMDAVAEFQTWNITYKDANGLVGEATMADLIAGNTVTVTDPDDAAVTATVDAKAILNSAAGLTQDSVTINGYNMQGVSLLTFDPTTGKFSGIGGVGKNTIDLFLNQIDPDGRFADITIDFSNVTMYNNSGVSTVTATNGDTNGLGTGRRIGQMSGISISNDGRIYASYDNGMSRLLGQIAVATFSNASGLEKDGDNLYKATQNSGDFDGIGVEITADGGYMTTGVLEMSNVDLSSEFTEMITTQRGFQANSRIITVSDTLLEELINLKR